MTLTASDPAYPRVLDKWEGGEFADLTGKFVVVLPDAQGPEPDPEALADIMISLREGSRLPRYGMQGNRLAFDEKSIMHAAAKHTLLREAVDWLEPSGTQRAPGIELFAVSYIREKGHSQGWHAHGVAGSTTAHGGGAHAGNVRDSVRAHQVHKGVRRGKGRFALRRGGVGGPQVVLELPDGSVWFMTREAAGELQFAPAPGDDPHQPAAERRWYHAVPPLRSQDSPIVITVMTKARLCCWPLPSGCLGPEVIHCSRCCLPACAA